jgi:hypothetical protein
LAAQRPTIVINRGGQSFRLERSGRMKGRPKFLSGPDSAAGEHNRFCDPAKFFIGNLKR